MTPEQFAIFLKANDESTFKAVEKFVNGDIRELKADVGLLRKEVEEHTAREEENRVETGKRLKEQTIKTETFQERAEPMLQAFENKKIVRAVVEKETKTITFYATSALTIGALLTGIWALIKWTLK